jgi:hypothetical protein
LFRTTSFSVSTIRSRYHSRYSKPQKIERITEFCDFTLYEEIQALDDGLVIGRFKGITYASNARHRSFKGEWDH